MTMDEKLAKALAEDGKLAKLISEAEKQGITIVVADENEELPKVPKLEREPKEIMARMIEYKMPPTIRIADYPSGQESRRKRREMERKSKKRR